MKFPGRLYHGKQTYLAMYSHFPDVSIGTPPSIEGSSQRVAHIAYSFGGNSRGIDIFLIPRNAEIPEIDLKKEIRTAKGNLSAVDKQQDIQYKLINTAPKEIIQLARLDIRDFCKGQTAKNLKGTRRTYHEIIVPKTKIRRINPERILTPGKQEFVPSCDLEANIDFSKGCVSGWMPGENSSFDGETFAGYFLSPYSECIYCYALPKHKSFPKTIFNIEKGRLKEELLGNCRLTVGSDKKAGRPVKVLRFGKRTEAGSKFTLETLALTLEICLETGTRTVLPTKFLEFNPEIAKLLKKTNSVVLYSIGFDEVEKGACSYGCTNEWRLEQAIKYEQAGVNSIFYLLINPFMPPKQREKRIIDLSKKHNIPIQLLPARHTSKIVAEKLTGFEWEVLKTPHATRAFLDEIENLPWGACEIKTGNVLIPKTIHSEWEEKISDNKGPIRMCHHNSEKTWCGRCYLNSEGFIIPTPKIEIKSLSTQLSRTQREKMGKNQKRFTFEENA